MASRVFIRRIIGASLLAAALAGCKLASYFTQDLIAEAAILAVFALSLDFLATCGLVSFGHAGLLGVGAYAFGGLTVLAGYSPGAALGGAVLGGLIVGLAESASVHIVGAEYRAAAAFAVLIAILLVKPNGLFGEPQEGSGR